MWERRRAALLCIPVEASRLALTQGRRCCVLFTRGREFPARVLVLVLLSHAHTHIHTHVHTPHTGLSPHVGRDGCSIRVLAGRSDPQRELILLLLFCLSLLVFYYLENFECLPFCVHASKLMLFYIFNRSWRCYCYTSMLMLVLWGYDHY